MDYGELVSSLELEALENPGEKVGELCAHAAEAIVAFHNRACELEADIEDLLQRIANLETMRP
jgi:hypothetical protein